MLDMKLASPRWAAIAIMDDHALILFDMHQAMDLKGCGVCRDIHIQADVDFMRWVVCAFRGKLFCSNCGNPTEKTSSHVTYYTGNDEDTARGVFAAEETRMHDAVLGGQ